MLTTQQQVYKVSSSALVLLLFIMLYFLMWWENSDQIWSHWDFSKLSTIQIITSEMAPKTCCLILDLLAFNPSYHYLWHVGTWYAQWASGRAGSRLNTLSVTLFPQMFSAMLRANKQTIRLDKPLTLGVYFKNSDLPHFAFKISQSLTWAFLTLCEGLGCSEEDPGSNPGSFHWMHVI